MRHASEVAAGVLGLAVLLAVSPAHGAGEGGEEASARRVLRCGDVITRDTRLTRDLACPGSTGPALRVARAGVVLDLGGHTVRRSGPDTGWSEGIVVEANSTVRNGTIEGFDWGYIVDGGSDVRLSRLTFRENWAAVFNRNGSLTTMTVTDCRLLRNRIGLASEQDVSSGTFKVFSTLFRGNELGFAASLHTVEVERSTFSANTLAFWCPDGRVRFRGSLFSRNEAVGSVPLGEFGYGTCYDAVFVDTVFAGNRALAPDERPAWEPFNLALHGAWFVDNGTHLEVRVQTLDVRRTLWWNNAGGLVVAEPGELLQPSLTGTVSDNRFLRNRGDGLRVTYPGTLTVSGNVAVANQGWGIHAPGVIDGGGNAARDNQDGDCFGVTCDGLEARPMGPLLAADDAPDLSAAPDVPSEEDAP